MQASEVLQTAASPRLSATNEYRKSLVPSVEKQEIEFCSRLGWCRFASFDDTAWYNSRAKFGSCWAMCNSDVLHLKAREHIGVMQHSTLEASAPALAEVYESLSKHFRKVPSMKWVLHHFNVGEKTSLCSSSLLRLARTRKLMLHYAR